MKSNFREIEIFWGMSLKISGQYSRFSGGLLFTHGSAQTAFVRAVPHPPPPVSISNFFSFSFKIPQIGIPLYYQAKDIKNCFSFLYSLMHVKLSDENCLTIEGSLAILTHFWGKQ